MKAFRKYSTTPADTTMTVAELRQALSCYPDDMPVVATWEGCLRGIDAENFQVCDDWTREPALLIDVEN